MNTTPTLSLNPQEVGDGTGTARIPAARRPAPTPTSLKAERVQLAAESPEARLRAERVEQKLRGLPGWRLVSGGKAIDRLRDLQDPHSAAAYAGVLTELASRLQQPIGIDLLGNRVGITLWTQPEHGRHVGLSEAVLNFARMLG